MFQSVIEQPGWRASRLGAGAGVSLLVHAGIFAVALLLSARVAATVQEPPDLVVRLVKQPPRGNPTPAVAPPSEPRREPRKRDPMKQPKTIPTVKPAEIEPPPTPVDAPPSNDLPHIPGSDPEGVDTGGVAGVPVITGLEQALTNVGPTGDDLYDFTTTSMKPPQLLTAPEIQYTREALAARVEGLLIARCIITREGDVERCRIIKGLPHMEEAVLSALENRRYQPVEYMGKPVSVSYNFKIRLEIPR
ncbi:MAG: energy transducer TonB [Myxococcaceae bacterium]|nr:energy transducer TonB [Myxococcaceae bacterium]